MRQWSIAIFISLSAFSANLSSVVLRNVVSYSRAGINVTTSLDLSYHDIRQGWINYIQSFALTNDISFVDLRSHIAAQLRDLAFPDDVVNGNPMSSDVKQLSSSQTSSRFNALAPQISVDSRILFHTHDQTSNKYSFKKGSINQSDYVPLQKQSSTSVYPRYF